MIFRSFKSREKSKFSFAALILMSVAATMALGFAGCTKNEIVRKAPEKTVRIRLTGTDFKMPSELWDKLLPAEEQSLTTVKSEDDDEGSAEAGINFAPVIVTLTEKNSGILHHSPVSFEFPQGGGMIDLAEWVTGKPGTFYVNFDVAGSNNPDLTVYYLSKAKKRRFDRQVFGAGCKSFFNIKKHYLREHSKYGIAVNTTRDLHTTILGGHFLFSWKVDDSFMVTQVQFMDSKNPQLFCDTDKKSAEAE